VNASGNIYWDEIKRKEILVRNSPLWEEWGLSFVLIRAAFLGMLPPGSAGDFGFVNEDYIHMVRAAHDAVAIYLYEHEEAGIHWRQGGYQYYDILHLADPTLSEKISQWANQLANNRSKQ
jgi:hypothetical protein